MMTVQGVYRCALIVWVGVWVSGGHSGHVWVCGGHARYVWVCGGHVGCVSGWRVGCRICVQYVITGTTACVNSVFGLVFSTVFLGANNLL